MRMGNGKSIRKKTIVVSVIFALLLSLSAFQAYSLDYPHFGGNSIGCDSCHFIYGTEPSLLPEWTSHTPEDIDDTQYNTLCWSCHNDIDAPYVRTHSSLQIDDSYGNWTVECRVCHNPHYQKQKEHGSESYLYSGTSTNVTTTTITKSGAGWSIDEYENMVVIPNITENKYIYKITGNTSDTLTIEGPIDLTNVSTGDTFAILYGQLVYDTVVLDDITNPDPSRSGNREVKFFWKTGDNSFADGNGIYDGVCEVCHERTKHFRNDGSGDDQHHSNVGGADGEDCTECHNHVYGFAHGGGSAGGNCDECHGHDPGYEGATGGAGTYKTHSTHTENDSDDLRGPSVGCDTCHNINSFPNFADGVSYTDYKSGADMTTVCNDCHSPGGTYDGLSNAVVGAKNNWTTRIYDDSDNSSLQAGKEKWCATCHDETPSEIQTISAPNVIGDEDNSGGEGIYGSWGFYKSGHGLDSSETYDYSGGITAGAGKECLDCHLSTAAHIDGNARTFDCSDSCDSTEYRQGYRLQQVSGSEPMEIPWTGTGGSNEDKFRLCTQAGCHDSGPFTDSNNFNTNLVTWASVEVEPDVYEDVLVNRHAYHLSFAYQLRYPADYNYSVEYNSRIICVTCHNVHGSTQLAMVRDGKLINREPGLKIWYNNDDIVSYIDYNTDPPDPENLPLSASTGTIWRGATSSNLCTHCHGNNNTLPKYRDPFQDVAKAPELDWTGELNYISDGANPDSSPGGSSFAFRVKYTDSNNDEPVFIEVWIDLNDDGDYNDGGEKIGMSDVDVSDTNYTDGKLYYRTETLSKAGDGILNYRFYASDGTIATGPPTYDSSVIVFNEIPTLNWTGETYFVSDGVTPNVGGNGSSFEFRISL
jgi:hypothetical protein